VTPEPFSIEILSAGATTRIVLRGELDLATVAQLDQAIHEAHGRGARQLLLDLRELQFIDSTGLHAFVRIDAGARTNGHNVSFVEGQPQVQHVLALTGLDDRFVFVKAPEDPTPPR
jgi:anti-sigma B factor antagonist